MLWASDDTSDVPGGELSYDELGRRTCWDVDIGAAHVAILTGASCWRVMMFKRAGDDDTKLITPHVFKTAREAYDWAKAWIKHRSVRPLIWPESWGTMPTWPKKGRS